MAYSTGERVFHKTQIGHETTPGLAVPATAILNGESGSISAMDRSPDDLQEDYGMISKAQPGRMSYGVRHATLPFRGVVRFEDIQQFLEAGVAGGVTPVATQTGAVQTWTFPADNTGTTLVSQTIEDGDNVAVYQLPFSLLTQLTMSFTNLASPGNSPWTLAAEWMAQDKIVIPSFSGGAVSPTSAETAMGHLTRAYLGSTSTAFASLSEEVGINAANIVIPTGVTPRVWGSAQDVYQSIGRMNRLPTGTFTFYQTTSAPLSDTVSNIYNYWATAPTVAQEQRLRIVCSGAKLYGTSEQQSITLTGGPTGGTFTLTFGAATTGNIAYNASAATVQTALRSLSTIGQYGVSVSGAAGGPYTVTFTGPLANTNVGAITGDGTGLTGVGAPYTVTIATPTPGVAGEYKSLIIDGRIRYTVVPVQDSNGATVYAAEARYVYDSTLGTDIQITVVNGISSLV